MDHFHRHDGEGTTCEEVGLEAIAMAVGTPCFVYSTATVTRHCRNLIAAFADYPTLPCFAVKANSNLSFLQVIFKLGLGADIVSLGELRRTELAGLAADRVVFSGVGKTDQEIRQALDAGILSFNVESEAELERVAKLARDVGKTAPVALRVNPNIDAKTHPKITTGLYSTKFGLPEAEILRLSAKIEKEASLQLVGLACHIGSQITDVSPLGEAATRMAALAKAVSSPDLTFINMGGGLGIRYQDENPPGLDDYAQTLIDAIRPTGLRLLIEPGRVIAGNSGILLTRVIGTKKTPDKTFIIVDAAMNDLLRPSIYGSYHEILNVRAAPSQAPVELCDIVGPICETGDFLGRDRKMAVPEPGSLLFVRGCGAYAATMSSQYNSRPRAAEVLVEGSNFRVIRERESPEDLWAKEMSGLL